MIKQLFISIIVSAVTATYASNKTIHTNDIIQATLSGMPNCLKYNPTLHACLWLSKTGKITTTPIVSHYSPDLVVSVFAKENPWEEINKIIDPSSKAIQKNIVNTLTKFDASSGNHLSNDATEQFVKFKEADIIGNPALWMMKVYGLLPNTVNPMTVYYQSKIDSALWRGIASPTRLDEAASINLRHVGYGAINWGSIYPHQGKVINDNDFKAAAVIAQRASDLISSENSLGHIYQKLKNDCGKHCHAASLRENDLKTCFQLIYPEKQNQCHVLGVEGSYSRNMLNETGNYVWIVWRYYEGCEDGNGHYIGRV